MNLRKGLLKAMGVMNGSVARSIMDNGSTPRWMALADCHGMKASFMLGSLTMINFMDRGITSGGMASTMLGNGLKASSMGKARFFKGARSVSVFGSMENAGKNG